MLFVITNKELALPFVSGHFVVIVATDKCKWLSYTFTYHITLLCVSFIYAQGKKCYCRCIELEKILNSSNKLDPLMSQTSVAPTLDLLWGSNVAD